MDLKLKSKVIVIEPVDQVVQCFKERDVGNRLVQAFGPALGTALHAPAAVAADTVAIDANDERFAE